MLVILPKHFILKDGALPLKTYTAPLAERSLKLNKMPNTTPKVKLSPAMKEVIKLMNEGWTLRKGVLRGAIRLYKNGNNIPVHRATFNSMGLNKIIQLGPAVGNDYTLTELGKSL